MRLGFQDRPLAHHQVEQRQRDGSIAQADPAEPRRVEVVEQPGREAGFQRDHQYGDQDQSIQRQQPQDAPFLGRGVVDHLARPRRVGVLALQSEHRPQRPLRDSAVLGR